MTCQSVQKRLSAVLDERLQRDENAVVIEHVARCAPCGNRLEQMHRVRGTLRRAVLAAPPELLTSKLLVLASHERERRLAFGTVGSAIAYFFGRLRLMLDHLMRPVAIPAAGGLASAVFLFAMLMPTLGFVRSDRNDVPIDALYTKATMIEMPPFNLSEDLVVEMTINAAGEMQDYSIPHGNLTPEQAGNIGNLLLFTSFNPATWFGRPTAGKITVSFRRRSWIFVRG